MMSTSAPLSVEILANYVEVANIAGNHAIQSAAATEERRLVRPAHPFIRPLRIWQQDVDRLEDPEEVGDALESVAADLANATCLPGMKRRAAVQAEQLHLLPLAQLPGL